MEHNLMTKEITSHSTALLMNIHDDKSDNHFLYCGASTVIINVFCLLFIVSQITAIILPIMA